jgi:hypothetical protein
MQPSVLYDLLFISTIALLDLEQAHIGRAKTAPSLLVAKVGSLLRRFVIGLMPVMAVH